MKQMENTVIAFARKELMAKFVDMPSQIPEHPYYLISAHDWDAAVDMATLMGIRPQWAFVPTDNFSFDSIRDQVKGYGIMYLKLIGLFSDAEQEYLGECIGRG